VCAFLHEHLQGSCFASIFLKQKKRVYRSPPWTPLPPICIEKPKHLANRILPWHLPNSSGDASFMHNAAWSRVKTIQRRQRRTTSLKPQGPEVTCEGMSFGFRIRGPPEEQAHLVLHAFVSVAIMDRGMYSCGFTLLCALHRPRPRRLRPSHPLTFLCASQQFYGSWLQVPRAGCGLVELSPFVRRVRDKLRLLIERDNHALSEPQSGLLELNCSSIPV
jgi:hypothetical protein